MLSILGKNSIKRDLYHIYVTYVQPTGAGKAGKRIRDLCRETDRQEGRIRSAQQEKAQGLKIQKAPQGEGKRVVPATGRRCGCPERAGSPQRRSPGRPGRDQAPQPGGI